MPASSGRINLVQHVGQSMDGQVHALAREYVCTHGTIDDILCCAFLSWQIREASLATAAECAAGPRVHIIELKQLGNVQSRTAAKGNFHAKTRAQCMSHKLEMSY